MKVFFMQLYNLLSTELQYDEGFWAFILYDLLYIYLNSVTQVQIKTCFY